MSVQTKVTQHSSSSTSFHDLKHVFGDPWPLFHAILPIISPAVTVSSNCDQLDQSSMGMALKWFAIVHAYIAVI